MSITGWYVLMLRFSLGPAAFAGLFLSPMAVSEKWFFGSAFLLIVFACDSYAVAGERFAERHMNLTGVIFSALDRGSEKTATQIAEQHLQSVGFRAALAREGDFDVPLMAAQYVVWAIIGWLICEYGPGWLAASHR